MSQEEIIEQLQQDNIQLREQTAQTLAEKRQLRAQIEEPSRHPNDKTRGWANELWMWQKAVSQRYCETFQKSFVALWPSEDPFQHVIGSSPL